MIVILTNLIAFIARLETISFLLFQLLYGLSAPPRLGIEPAPEELGAAMLMGRNTFFFSLHKGI